MKDDDGASMTGNLYFEVFSIKSGEEFESRRAAGASNFTTNLKMLCETTGTDRDDQEISTEA